MGCYFPHSRSDYYVVEVLELLCDIKILVHMLQYMVDYNIHIIKMSYQNISLSVVGSSQSVSVYGIIYDGLYVVSYLPQNYQVLKYICESKFWWYLPFGFIVTCSLNLEVIQCQLISIFLDSNIGLQILLLLFPCNIQICLESRMSL